MFFGRVIDSESFLKLGLAIEGSYLEVALNVSEALDNEVGNGCR